MQRTLLKTRYFERGLSKNLKKLSSLFSFASCLFYGQDYVKQKGPETSCQSIFGLQNMFRKIPFLVIYHQIILMIYYKIASQLCQKLNFLIYAS